jgi:hypothetical protein
MVNFLDVNIVVVVVTKPVLTVTATVISHVTNVLDGEIMIVEAVRARVPLINRVIVKIK